MHHDIALIIPARLASSRLYQKALQPIGDKPMVQHVYERALAGGFTHTYVATDSVAIAEVITDIGGKVIMTSETHSTGTDRVYEALCKLELTAIDYVINLQGDMPFIASHVLNELAMTMRSSNADISTLAAKVDRDYALSESNVKVTVDNNGKALYFSRQPIPHGANEFLYHVGIYGYTIGALKRFVTLPEAYIEQTEKLEQLRALASGMQIQVCETEIIPISVDTPADLAKAIEYYKQNFKAIV